MKNIINDIKEREKERAYLIAVLDIWAQVKAQGIDHNTVKSFGFRSDLLPEKRKWNRGQSYYIERLPTGETRPKYHNYVRHHDGSITVLDPLVRAVYRD